MRGGVCDHTRLRLAHTQAAGPTAGIVRHRSPDPTAADVLTYPAATPGNWETVTHVGIFDAATAPEPR